MSISILKFNSARRGKQLGHSRLALYATAIGISAASLFGITDATAQSKFFSVPDRAVGQGAKGMAIIHTLLEENKQRKQETTQNRDDIQLLDGRLGTAEGQISALEAEMADIEPHAKAALAACGSSGKVLHWDGSAWVCADEADPTVGPHALVTKTPPFCHEVNAKLLWSADGGGNWKCAIDQMGDTSPYITAETDPTIQSVSSGRLCYGTGSKIACDSAAPTLSSGTLGVNSLDVSGNLTGTAAHFTGAVSGALPTATNHLATKAYVDSAVVAAGGGGGGSATCGTTRTIYNGDLGGFSGADAKCVADFGPGWRFATWGNLASGLRMQHPNGSINGWVIQYGVNVDAPAHTCAGWSSGESSMNGTVYAIGNFGSAPNGCMARYPIWCCNF